MEITVCMLKKMNRTALHVQFIAVRATLRHSGCFWCVNRRIRTNIATVQMLPLFETS
ncbi:MAG TPA: hypothetical protein VNQ57_03910 [Ureibacillus sp.]|nr:hypothetical protein [Ureibacillus sp.]